MKIEEFIEEINELKRAKSLLEQIYHEIGPYGDRKISSETRYDLQDYFDFDDSE